MLKMQSSSKNDTSHVAQVCGFQTRQGRTRPGHGSRTQDCPYEAQASGELVQGRRRLGGQHTAEALMTVPQLDKGKAAGPKEGEKPKKGGTGTRGSGVGCDTPFCPEASEGLGRNYLVIKKKTVQDCP